MGKLFGDMIGDLAKALGFKECSGCKKRRRKLNAAHAKLRGRKIACPECDKAKHVGGSR
jgi:hypothetical protein